MNISEIVATLDVEIGRLERAKAFLSEGEPVARRRGRPKGSTNKQTSFNSLGSPGKLRPEVDRDALEAISASQRRRRVKQKETAALKKTSAKKLTAKKGTGTPGAVKQRMHVLAKRAARAELAKASSKESGITIANKA